MPYDDQLPAFDIIPSGLSTVENQLAKTLIMNDSAHTARLLLNVMGGENISWETEKVRALKDHFKSTPLVDDTVEVPAQNLKDIKISMILHLIYPTQCEGFGIHYDPPTIRDGLLLCHYFQYFSVPDLDKYKYALDVPLTNSNGSTTLNLLPLSILMSDLPEECEPDNIQNYIHQDLPTNKLIYHTLRSIKLTPDRLFVNFAIYAKLNNVTFPGDDVVGYVKRHLTTRVGIDNSNTLAHKPIWISTGADRTHQLEFTLEDILYSNLYIFRVINNIYYNMHQTWFDSGEVINVNGADIYIHRHNLLLNAPASLDLNKPPAEQFADIALKLATEEYASEDNARYPGLFSSYLPAVEGSHRQLILGTDLKSEGRIMRHCIGGYDSRIKDSSSLFFHLDIPNVHHGGTLEMTRYDPKQRESLQYEVWMVPGNERLEWWVVSQFYGQCNLELKKHTEGRKALHNFLNTHMVRISHQALDMIHQNSALTKMMGTTGKLNRASIDSWGIMDHQSYDRKENRDTITEVIHPNVTRMILTAITNYQWDPNKPKIDSSLSETHLHEQDMIKGIDQTLDFLDKISDSKLSVQQLAHQAFLKRQRKFL